MEDRDEILRLRERLHDFTTRIVAVELMCAALSRWKDEVDVTVEGLREADRIAEAVAEKMKELSEQDRRSEGIRLTYFQAVVGAAAVLVSCAALLANVLERVLA